MPKPYFLRPLAACAIALVAVPLFAATLIGNVNDDAGKPLAGVVITLRDAGGQKVGQQTSNADGLVTFADLRPGRYSVEGGAKGAVPFSQAVEITDAPTASVSVTVRSEPLIATIQVTAARLKEARIALSPKIGTTVYTLDSQFVAEYGSGDNAAMNETLLRLPGVAQDSKASGSLHVRDEHANVQYRINGIPLPEGISGFGQSVDSRFVDRIDFVTGALPAQYGLRTAGVVDIETKDGSAPGGNVSLLGGGHDTLQPGIEAGGTKGALTYYITANFLTNTLGIENPVPTRNALHDRTRQTRGFAYLSDVVDQDTRIGAMFGTYQGNFQIPNNPDQAASFSLTGISDISTGLNTRPSADLDERQREVNHYAILSLQKKVGALDFQASGFYQYSSLHYLPDTQGGDLIYTGVASDVFRSNSAAGVQADASYKLNDAHTPRFGFAYTHQLTRSDNNVAVFPVDAGGNQTSSDPQTIVDDSSKRGNLSSLYVQDEWRLDPRLTLNYGLRFDHVAAFTDEHQFSPRLNALWRLTDATTLHLGYSRFFTPPPQELVAEKSIALYAGTTNAPKTSASDTVKAERAHYFDVGVAQTISPRLSIGVDAYYKRITNLLDEGQFGQALILTPFNYADGYTEGLEFSSTYADPVWSGYLNFAVSKGKGRNIVSGQSLFGVDELAYIANHSIYLDHDQRYSLSGGLTYRFGESRVSSDVIYGSGLRRTPAGTPPNSGKLPSYATLNLALIHDWKQTPVGDLEGRLGVVNLFDKTYLLRDGSGVGVGAPQYGARRTWFVAVRKAF